MFHKIRRRAQSERGFTLIELLVVILIIGILAAIAIPAFLAQRGKAQDTEAKSAARTAQTAMETFYTDEQDYNVDAAGLQKIEPSLNDGAGASLVVAGGADNAGDDGYSVTVTSKTKGDFTITKAPADDTVNSVKVTRTCTAAGKFGCKGDGTW